MRSDMLRKLLRPTVILTAVVAAEAIALVAVIGVHRWRTAGVSAVERGRLIAEHQGCHACHGPGGTQGIANPGSDETEVPAWSGGTAMMYVHSDDDIREWILDGKPRGHDHEAHEHGEHAHRGEHAHGDEHAPQTDPTDPTGRSEEGERRPVLTMPAYRDRLTDGELADFVAELAKNSGPWRHPRPNSRRIRLQGHRRPLGREAHRASCDCPDAEWASTHCGEFSCRRSLLRSLSLTMTKASS